MKNIIHMYVFMMRVVRYQIADDQETFLWGRHVHTIHVYV